MNNDPRISEERKGNDPIQPEGDKDKPAGEGGVPVGSFHHDKDKRELSVAKAYPPDDPDPNNINFLDVVPPWNSPIANFLFEFFKVCAQEDV